MLPSRKVVLEIISRSRSRSSRSTTYKPSRQIAYSFNYSNMLREKKYLRSETADNLIKSKLSHKQTTHLSVSKCNDNDAHYSTSTSSTSTKDLASESNNSFPIIYEDAPLNKSSKDFLRNAAIFKKYVEKLDQAKEIAHAGGGEKSIERHVKRHGKMLVHDRVKALVDNIDDFLELSLIGGIGMEYGHVPRASSLIGMFKK